MPKTISRAPQTPRNIRDIRPKRQLQRNNPDKKKEGAVAEDDGWYSDKKEEPTHFRGVAAVHRFGRRAPGKDAPPNAKPTDDSPDDGHARRRGIFSTLKWIYARIRQVPPPKRRRWTLIVVILLTALRTYFADINRYSTKGKPKKHTRPLMTMNDEFSSFKDPITDDEPSFSDAESKMAFGSSSSEASKGKRKSGIAGSMRNLFVKKKKEPDFNSFGQSGQTNSMSPIFGEHKSGSMGDSMNLGGGNAFGASSQNNMNNMQSNAFGSNPMGGQSYQLGGQSQGWGNSQAIAQTQHQANQFQGLRGQSSLENSQPLSQGAFGGASFGEPAKQPMGTNNFMRPMAGSNRADSGLQSSSVETVSRTNPIPIHGSSGAGLDCGNLGGPFSEAEYSEIVYWWDIPSDASFASPFYNQQAQEAKSTSFWKTKYLTFEMDDAGFNNMRLGLENVILLAHSMGRTLVMPPRRQMAHGLADSSGSKVVSFSDFYDLAAISSRQKGLNIITMEQFLEREALNGHLKSRVDEEAGAVYPPNNQIKWDNQRLDPLWTYIRSVGKSFKWNPKECVLAFAAAGTKEQQLFSMMADVLVEKDGRPFPHYSEYQGKPVNVDAPAIERFREMLAGRRKICMYDQSMHEENQVVHFKADPADGDGTRLIANFYAFQLFEDWQHGLWSKRFIRDNVRYNNEIMCLSARIISALRGHARNGLYDSAHIRVGDFQQQFPMTKMDPTQMLAELQEHVAPGSTLFIATDERDPSFFDPLREVYDTKFIGDFGSLLADVNPNYYPLVEQVVASRGRIFFGTFYSTFSAFIMRLRGYYSVKERHDGHMTGVLLNSFYFGEEWKREMKLYQAIHKPLFGRDFPVAWRDIDRLELPS
ncbi:hypothetical protein ACHAXT_006901 [Thalassiosira profunda]